MQTISEQQLFFEAIAEESQKRVACHHIGSGRVHG